MNFTDLNEDCVLLILGRLTFGDLLSVVQINGKLSMLAADVYRRKYSQWSIFVCDPETGLDYKYLEKLLEMMNIIKMTEIDTDTLERVDRELSYLPKKAPQLAVTYFDNYILLKDYETILIAFKHFGHEIKKLHISSMERSPPFKHSFFGYLISKYSCESLVDIEVGYDASDLLYHITKPLINVEYVTFSLFFKDLKPDFSQRVETILPQIKTLKLSQFRSSFNQNNGSIQLENVNTLVNYGASTSLNNLHFPALHTLYIDCRNIHNNVLNYYQFLNDHNHLRQLHLKQFLLHGSQLLELTADLKDLVEVTLEYVNNVTGVGQFDANAIMEFLSTHDKVKQLNLFDFPKDWTDELQEQLKHEWSTRISNNGISFERT